METIALHDFVEVEYTGKFKDGTVFDTTNKEIAQKNKIFSAQMKYEPLVVCVGERQLVSGVDKALPGKEEGTSFTVDLKPEEAFGKKDFKNIKLVPIIEFINKKINPQPGMQIDMDGEIGVVIRAAGGRVMVNFNHPFAGKEVIYEIKINKKITDKKTQLDAFLNLSLNFPGIKTEVVEDKAIISFPVELPKELTEGLSKRLKEIIKFKEVEFRKEGKKEKAD